MGPWRTWTWKLDSTSDYGHIIDSRHRSRTITTTIVNNGVVTIEENSVSVKPSRTKATYSAGAGRVIWSGILEMCRESRVREENKTKVLLHRKKKRKRRERKRERKTTDDPLKTTTREQRLECARRPLIFLPSPDSVLRVLRLFSQNVEAGMPITPETRRNYIHAFLTWLSCGPLNGEC